MNQVIHIPFQLELETKYERDLKLSKNVEREQRGLKEGHDLSK